MGKCKFKQNQRIIYDSGFGYEIGYFQGEGLLLGTYQVDICTGVSVGLISHSKKDIINYSDDVITALSSKYGYEKRFSDVF